MKVPPLRLVCASAMVALLAAGCSWCTHPTRPSSGTVTIVYSTGVTGNLEPCGCSPDQRGGVARAAAGIEKIRKEGHPVLVLDGGDRFFPATPIPTDPLLLTQQQRQAQTMADATGLMHYDALVYTPRDSRADAALFGRAAQASVLDLGDNATAFTKPSLIQKEDGVTVGVFAVGDQENAADLIRTRAAGLKSQGARIIVLLAYRTIERAKLILPAAKEAGVTVVLAGRADVPETHESAAFPDTQPPLFTTKARGEALLRIDIAAEGPPDAPFVKVTGQGERDATLDAMQKRIEGLRADAISRPPMDPRAKQITNKLLELEGRKAALAAAPPPKMPSGQNVFSYAFVPMSPSLPDQPEVRAAIERYNAANASENLAYAQTHPKTCPAAEPGKATYVGDQACIDCHKDAYDFWKTTPHSHAYADLVQKNKQYNVACIGCHVLAWEKPSGTCDIAKTFGRQNVQCESCHGPGSIHVDTSDAADIRREVPEAQCRTCHESENSPHFNYATYRPQILGKGHGASM